MNNLGLYLVSVLIWGSTWLAITFQFGPVRPEVSVCYRFGLASAVLFLWCGVRRLRLRFSPHEHGWIALQGALLFGVNYVCVYLAESRISSGLVAVAFSLIVFLNILGTRVFFGTPVKPATLFAAALGIAGVVLVFLPEFRRASLAGGVAAGITYAVAGTVSASLGNMVVMRNQRHGLPVVQLNTYGMLYGALLVAAFAALAGVPFRFDGSMHYLLSIGYLALFGSVLAFGAYLTLVGRIGADRAGYTGAAIPIVALALSSVFEGLRWHLSTVLGAALCVSGNILVLRRRCADPVRR